MTPPPSSASVPDAFGALVERVVPGHGTQPSASALALADTMRADGQPGGPTHTVWTRVITPGLALLDTEAETRHGQPIASLDAEAQGQLLDALDAGDTTAEWPTPASVFLGAVSALAAERYWATPSPAWDAISYDPSPKRGPGVDVDERVPTATPFDAIDDRYDVVIVGAGAAGGVVADVLSEAGASVLLVDRGEVLRYDDVGRDHLSNHRLARFGFNTPSPTKGDDPRVLATPGGRERTIDLTNPAYASGPWAVGGGTRVYQGMAWRFLPVDFELGSHYGVPEGSSLADWPLTYDELEPAYTRAEWELGVCGNGHAHRVQGPRSKDYPMPAVPLTREGALLTAAAAELGWTTGPVPLLINSEPRDGRAQCVQCGTCVGFACPSDAKNGTMNVSIPRAQARGNTTLVAMARATQVVTDDAGRVQGVELVDRHTGNRRVVTGGHVVVTAGAIETARLLLSSRSTAHPAGLGNATDQVGRHLQGHIYVSAFGLFDEPVQDMTGPGVSVATCDFVHGYDGFIGGGVLANKVVKLPAMFWHWALDPSAPRRGAANQAAMAEQFARTGHVFGPIQEIPNPDSRVTLAADVVDADGIPVVRLSGSVHPESLRVAERHRDTAAEWLGAAGASKVWHAPIPTGLSAGQHQAGTCRMGDDPATSVTDRWGQVHGHDNLWVMDASLHVTNGGFNPVLHIFALAYHCAEELARR
jgi:choline dehydrogenase-like flavoprotein